MLVLNICLKSLKVILIIKENRVENGPPNKRKQCLKAEKIIINSIRKNILRDCWQIIDRV